MLGTLQEKPSNFEGLVELLYQSLGRASLQDVLPSSNDRIPDIEGTKLHFHFIDDSRLDHLFQFSSTGMTVRPSERGVSNCVYTAWEPYIDFFTCRRSKEQLFMDGDWAFSHGRTGTFDFFELSSAIGQLESRLPILAWIDMEKAIKAISAASCKLNSCSFIERVSNLRREDFMANYASLGKPVILADTFATWPTREFSFDWLLKIYERRNLVYDVGNGSMFSLPVSDYIERVARNDPVPKKLGLPLTQEFLKHYRHPQYFPQISFFLKAQSLIVAPEDASAKRGYGNATCWHCDLADNFLIQLIGRKRVQLAPPHNAGCFYLSKTEPSHDNVGFFQSPVDPKDPDLTKYPSFANVSVMECTIGPGDTLFIPCGWFHNVGNLTPSVGVNCWKIFPFAEVAPELGATDNQNIPWQSSAGLKM